jgi:TrpR family transcriptional regulator, trp operon repressor
MNRANLDELAQILTNFTDNKETLAFLKQILTPRELEEIPKRLQVVKMLKQGIAQREIAKKLGVGIATVTRGSRELAKGSFKNLE